jgi:hypothetical protein
MEKIDLAPTPTKATAPKEITSQGELDLGIEVERECAHIDCLDWVMS